MDAVVGTALMLVVFVGPATTVAWLRETRVARGFQIVFLSVTRFILARLNRRKPKLQHGLKPLGSRGSTLLDAVVGTALMLVVFVGIVGAFRLTVMAVSNNKARAGAIALANERLEYIRSLSYNAIGTMGGIPAGAIAQTEVLTLNDVAYTRRTFVSYEDDPNDGLGGADTNGVTADYKAAKTSVSWESRDGTHTLTLVSRISPLGIETNVPGGTLAFDVVNASIEPVANAELRIVNDTVDPAIDMTTYTDDGGIATVIGAPAGSDYEITVTKSGYSTAQTYGATATNTNPIPAHLGVAESQTTAATFGIDVLGSKHIETYTPVTRATTTDPFSNDSRIASSTNITVSTGDAHLSGTSGSYPAYGMLISTAVSTTSLAQWHALSWIANEPASTNVAFRIYDVTGTSLISDAQIPGNSAGLTTSPVDLRAVATTTYLSLTVHATLTSSNPSVTPSIDSWSVSNDSGPVPLSNLALSLTGSKTIGTTGGGALIYKYDDQALSSGSSGAVTINDLEWDAYTILVPASTGYDISSACGSQPEALAPGSSQTTRLFLSPHTTNSLLVDVKNGAGVVVSNASVRLYRSGYDTTGASDGCGSAFFSGLSTGTVGGGNPYSIDVQASGYQAYTSSEVNISGTSRLSVILNN